MTTISTRRCCHLPGRLVPIAALVGLAAGCASAPVSYPALDQARADVAAARSSPEAARYAQLELQKADDLLHRADEAAHARQADEVTHEAYLASQTSRIALAVGADKAAQAHIAQSDAERAGIELAARTREAQLATARAQSATAQAESATARAESAESAARDAQVGEARFEQELANLQAQKSARGLVITLRDVLFATGKAELQPGAELALDKLASALKDAPDRAVDVDGFTDIVGSEQFNLILSQKRAQAVRTALMARGIDSARITVHGYGKDYPIASNDTEAGRQLNRRVEIVVADGNGAIPPRQALNQ
jgi:outer membrane protein OmpA-like peptidoglycan-associated protein